MYYYLLYEEYTYLQLSGFKLVFLSFNTHIKAALQTATTMPSHISLQYFIAAIGL